MEITIKGNSLEISDFILELQTKKEPCSKEESVKNEARSINARYLGGTVTNVIKGSKHGDSEQIQSLLTNVFKTNPGIKCEYLGCKNSATTLTTDDQGVTHHVCNEHIDLSSIIRKALK